MWVDEILVPTFIPFRLQVLLMDFHEVKGACQKVAFDALEAGRKMRNTRDCEPHWPQQAPRKALEPNANMGFLSISGMDTLLGFRAGALKKKKKKMLWMKVAINVYGALNTNQVFSNYSKSIISLSLKTIPTSQTTSWSLEKQLVQGHI